MEKQLIEAEGIPYHGISAGKLRRYLSLKNLSDMFRLWGTQAVGFPYEKNPAPCGVQ